MLNLSDYYHCPLHVSDGCLCPLESCTATLSPASTVPTNKSSSYCWYTCQYAFSEYLSLIMPKHSIAGVMSWEWGSNGVADGFFFATGGTSRVAFQQNAYSFLSVL